MNHSLSTSPCTLFSLSLPPPVVEVNTITSSLPNRYLRCFIVWYFGVASITAHRPFEFPIHSSNSHKAVVNKIYDSLLAIGISNVVVIVVIVNSLVRVTGGWFYAWNYKNAIPSRRQRREEDRVFQSSSFHCRSFCPWQTFLFTLAGSSRNDPCAIRCITESCRYRVCVTCKLRFRRWRGLEDNLKKYYLLSTSF